MRVSIAAEACDVVAAIDVILNETNTPPLSVRKVVSLVRQRTGSMRSDADLEALVSKIAAARGVPLDTNRNSDRPAR
jgi:hypothetical protein